VWGCTGVDSAGCDYISAAGGRAVESHRSGTHNRKAPRGPLTPAATIRAVIRAVEEAKAAKIKGYATAAAQTLNEQGVVNTRRRPWTGASVSSLYSEYRDKSGFRSRPRPLSAPRPVVVTTEPSRVVERADVTFTAEAAGVARDLQRLALEMAKAMGELADRLDRVPTVDPEVADKARRYDQLRGLLET